MNNVSIVINTYNAEKYLREALSSVKDFSEIIICDMYSTDNTIDVAKEFNAKIVYHENTGYVEPARNFAIQNASNDWVLLLDADEVVTPDLLKELQYHFPNRNNYAAIAIPRKNYFMGKFMHAAFPDYVIRFFNKNYIDWPKVIHSVPKIKGEIIKLKKSPKVALEHLADDSISDILKKMNSYTIAEVVRRKNQKVTFGKIIFSPLFRFIKFYFFKQGYKDGIRGLIFAFTKAHYKFYTLAKLFESSKKE